MSTKEINGIACFTVKLEVTHSSLSDNLDVLLLDSDPNPSYYAWQNFPPSQTKIKDQHLYLLAKKQTNCFQDIVLRHANQIAQATKNNLFIYPGQMTYHNEPRQGIRIHCSNTDYLPVLLDKLKELNIQLLSNKKVAKYSSLIFYKKYVELEQLEDGVYVEKNNENRFFFELAHQLDYEELYAGMQTIKNNCNYHLFDTFLASLFIKNRAQDYIGIFSKHCDKGRFGELKENIKTVFNH